MSNFIAKLWCGCMLAASVWPATAQKEVSGAAEVKLALAGLRITGSALLIAAHPDDENTAVLAWLARGRNVRAGYLSITRGEGGQNLIGSEQGDALGVIRTEELLAARRVDGAEQFFTRAIDFGFSKTSKESLAKWGHDAVLSDVVWVIRRFRPDVVILRFSGTSMDGHGQHQASALLGKEAYDAASDPKRFPEQLKWVQPWRAKRLVWNAFAFDREQEKKAATTPGRIVVDTGTYNPVIGRSYREIAGISRSQHRSQGMGAGEARGKSLDYFQPILGDAAQADLFDGVDLSWNRVPGGAAVGDLLTQADARFAPEHPESILPLLLEARRKLQALTAADPQLVPRKLSDLDRTIAMCAGLWADATANRASISPGSKWEVTVTALKRLSPEVKLSSFDLAAFNRVEHQSVDSMLAMNELLTRKVTVQAPEDAPYSQPFWLAQARSGDMYRIDNRELIGRAAPLPVIEAKMKFEVSGVLIELNVPVMYRYVDRVRGELTRPIEVVPPVAVNLAERSEIFPTKQPRSLTVQVLATDGPAEGELQLEGEKASFHLNGAGDRQDVRFEVPAPANKKTFRAVAVIAKRKISTGTQSISYEHIPPRTIFREAAGTLEPIDLKVLPRLVGYVMGAGDAVPDAIRQMGCGVSYLSDDDLLRGDLARFDAIVTGVRAYNVRTDLRAAQPRLLEYVKAGGTLIVQYNVLEGFRPTGAASQELGQLGPFPFEITRDRVTEEDSPVVLNSSSLWETPNHIGISDFDGWVQERGLYFAGKWDDKYQPVLSTHDSGEKELKGGMLFAHYGKGAYIFTAYSWFRQLPAGVPGAYRIFANLLSAK